MDTSTTSSLNAGPTTAPGLPAPAQSQPHVDADSAVTGPATPRRALVLGGGGSTGNAWLIGIIAGLFDAGLDVTTADLTIGTSAGSTAAAQLAGATPTELFDAIVAASPPEPANNVRGWPGWVWRGRVWRGWVWRQASSGPDGTDRQHHECFHGHGRYAPAIGGSSH